MTALHIATYLMGLTDLHASRSGRYLPAAPSQSSLVAELEIRLPNQNRNQIYLSLRSNRGARLG